MIPSYEQKAVRNLMFIPIAALIWISLRAGLSLEL
jgi:hypothetical protein